MGTVCVVVRQAWMFHSEPNADYSLLKCSILDVALTDLKQPSGADQTFFDGF